MCLLESRTRTTVWHCVFVLNLSLENWQIQKLREGTAFLPPFYLCQRGTIYASGWTYGVEFPDVRTCAALSCTAQAFRMFLRFRLQSLVLWWCYYYSYSTAEIKCRVRRFQNIASRVMACHVGYLLECCTLHDGWLTTRLKVAKVKWNGLLMSYFIPFPVFYRTATHLQGLRIAIFMPPPNSDSSCLVAERECSFSTRSGHLMRRCMPGVANGRRRGWERSAIN